MTGASAVQIINWPEIEMPLQSGTYGAMNQVWQNQQANANQWASQAKANDDAWREQHKKDIEAWTKQQDKWFAAWAIAQAAYAAAQTLLANNALDAAKDAAAKQYNIANRQQNIAEEEYARYKQHFAACENKTIDEECARPEYSEDIEAQANRAVVEVRKQFSLARQQLQRRRQRYCIGSIIYQEQQLAVEEARAIAQAKEKVRRYLEERQESRRDKYFNRKLQLFNIGRNIKADAIGEFGKAAQGIAAGTNVELAARNQFYGAIMSSLGGVMGAFLPQRQMGYSFSQGQRFGSSIGGLSTRGYGDMPEVGTIGYPGSGWSGFGSEG